MRRRPMVAVTVAAVVAAGSALAALGLILLPDAPTSGSGNAPAGGVQALTPVQPMTPGGVGADDPTGGTTTPATSPAAADTSSTPSTSPSTRATTTGSAAGGSATASLAGRIEPGVRYRGVATFYGADGSGNCMFDPTGDLMVAAMNHTDYEASKACGAYVQVFGPSGNRITVRITDQCPECPPGALDLSRQAFERLAPASTGRIAISWRLVSPGLTTPISLRYKEGSTRYWCALQVRNHRNPIARLAVRVGGRWRTLPRADYNYFVSADGAGCGGAVRVTDIYGQRITVSNLALRAGVVQRGPAQFTRR